MIPASDERLPLDIKHEPDPEKTVGFCSTLNITSKKRYQLIVREAKKARTRAEDETFSPVHGLHLVIPEAETRGDGCREQPNTDTQDSTVKFQLSSPKTLKPPAMCKAGSGM